MAQPQRFLSAVLSDCCASFVREPSSVMLGPRNLMLLAIFATANLLLNLLCSLILFPTVTVFALHISAGWFIEMRFEKRRFHI